MRRLHDDLELQMRFDDIVRELFAVGYDAKEVWFILVTRIDCAFDKFIDKEDEYE